jgi:hypothetical protein
MPGEIAVIVDRIRALEADLEKEFEKRRAALHFSIINRRIVFEHEVARRHRLLKEDLARYILDARPLHIVTAPVIYALIVPFAVLDVWVTLYQAICFRVWSIPRVRRGDYMIFDRQYLAYLNALEKLNCAYCSYANGVIAFVREVAARTEQYWCPIKHARARLAAHDRYAKFADFGDAEGYRHSLEDLRDNVKRAPTDTDSTG